MSRPAKKKKKLIIIKGTQSYKWKTFSPLFSVKILSKNIHCLTLIRYMNTKHSKTGQRTILYKYIKTKNIKNVNQRSHYNLQNKEIYDRCYNLFDKKFN